MRQNPWCTTRMRITKLVLTLGPTRHRVITQQKTGTRFHPLRQYASNRTDRGTLDPGTTLSFLAIQTRRTVCAVDCLGPALPSVYIALDRDNAMVNRPIHVPHANLIPLSASTRDRTAGKHLTADQVPTFEGSNVAMAFYCYCSAPVCFRCRRHILGSR